MEHILLRQPSENTIIWDNAEIQVLEAFAAKCLQMDSYNKTNKVFQQNWRNLISAIRYFKKTLQKQNVSLYGVIYLKHDIVHGGILKNSLIYKPRDNASMHSKASYMIQQIRMKILDKLDTQLDTNPAEVCLHHKEYLRIRNEGSRIAIKLKQHNANITLFLDADVDPLKAYHNTWLIPQQAFSIKHFFNLNKTK